VVVKMPLLHHEGASQSLMVNGCVIGLRTLCLAVADIDPKFYTAWNQQYQLASTSVDNRQQLVERAAERIEKVCYSFIY